jgi:multiple sugar transport system permease protein
MRTPMLLTGLRYLGLLLLVTLFVVPIVFMLSGSFKPDARVLTEAGSWQAFLPASLDLHNYRDVFARVDFGRYLLNSVFITSMVVLLGLAVNSLAGYGFARLTWRGRNLLFALVLAILILPLEAIAVPLFYEVTLFGWRDTYLVQILPFVANAFSIYLFHTFFLGLPRELEEAARIDGAGTLRIFLTIIVPNSKPVFATVAILTFLTQWGVYIWPLLVTSGEAVRPLPLAIATFYTLPPLQWGDIFAFGVMMVLPIVLVFLFFQRWFIRGVVSTGIKG